MSWRGSLGRECFTNISLQVSKINRYDFKRQGQRFVSWLLSFLIFVCAVYFIAHKLWPSEKTMPQLQALVAISKAGGVTARDPSALDWYLGSVTVKPVLEATGKRNLQIETLQNEVYDLIQQARERSQDSQGQSFVEIKSKVEEGDYQGAGLILSAVQRGFGDGSLNAIGRSLFVSLNEHINTLDRLRREQNLDIANLTPSLMSSFFWTSPEGALYEVLFWSLFGVITYLLVNSAEYLRTGRFKPSERWVTYTKLVYGPMLSLVLVLAIMNGYFDLGSYSVRAHTLPLVAFIFGYAARNIVTLFDKLVERVLGAAGTSIEAGPEAAVARRQADIDDMMASAKPQTMAHLKAMANEIAHPLIQTNIAQKEAST